MSVIGTDPWQVWEVGSKRPSPGSGLGLFLMAPPGSPGSEVQVTPPCLCPSHSRWGWGVGELVFPALTTPMQLA